MWWPISGWSVMCTCWFLCWYPSYHCSTCCIIISTKWIYILHMCLERPGIIFTLAVYMHILAIGCPIFHDNNRWRSLVGEKLFSMSVVHRYTCRSKTMLCSTTISCIVSRVTELISFSILQRAGGKIAHCFIHCSSKPFKKPWLISVQYCVTHW